MNNPRLRRVRKRLLIISIIFFGIALLLIGLSFLFPLFATPPGPGCVDGNCASQMVDVLPTLLALLGAGVSVVSAIGTFLGFLFTTIIMWRKEMRDSRMANIDHQIKEAQLEKLRNELRQP